MQTLSAQFETRRDAEMSVEQLVQVLGIDRTQVFLAAAETENTAGTRKAGSDTEDGRPDPDANPALEGRIALSVDLEDEAVDAAETVLREHNAKGIERR
jgi:hypothetical protein